MTKKDHFNGLFLLPRQRKLALGIEQRCYDLITEIPLNNYEKR